jgi:hypothetical protein
MWFSRPLRKSISGRIGLDRHKGMSWLPKTNQPLRFRHSTANTSGNMPTAPVYIIRRLRNARASGD